MNKQITVERVLLVAILIVSAMIFFGKSSVNIGVARDASQFDSDVYISKTLETAGNITASKTATTTVAVGNTGVGKICLWNGTQFTIMSFAAGTTTLSNATSTTCQ